MRATCGHAPRRPRPAIPPSFCDLPLPLPAFPLFGRQLLFAPRFVLRSSVVGLCPVGPQNCRARRHSASPFLVCLVLWSWRASQRPPCTPKLELNQSARNTRCLCPCIPPPSPLSPPSQPSAAVPDLYRRLSRHRRSPPVFCPFSTRACRLRLKYVATLSPSPPHHKHMFCPPSVPPHPACTNSGGLWKCSLPRREQEATKSDFPLS